MPVWNREGLVGRAIQSALSQTYPVFELIVVDDGSTDGTAEAVRAFDDPRIAYHLVDHAGVCAARNYGLAQAQHPWIAYLDSDNVWHPEFLEKMLTAVEEPGKAREAAYCIANLYRRDARTGEFAVLKTVGEPFDYGRLVFRNYIDLNTFVHSRRCLELAGNFDEDLRRLVDWDLILRIGARFEPHFVPEVLVDYYLGIADNAITLTEAGRPAWRSVRRKTVDFQGPVRVTHDGIEYRWDDVPEEKYYNWARAQSWVYGDQRRQDTATWQAYAYPYLVQVEVTSLCNLGCPGCPAGRDELNRPRRNMTMPEFAGIVDDAEPWLLLMVLWDWGEPFMNPDLPEMIRYASERDIRTVTSTNAHFLGDDDYVAQVLESGLSTLIVAIDSQEAERYRVYRRGGDLDTALAGLRKVVEIKKETGSDTTINMRMVVMKQNEHEIGELRKLAREVGADTFVAKTVNPSCGTTALDEELVPVNPALRRYRYRRGTYERLRCDAMCTLVWFSTNVLSNGDVVPCSYDYDCTMSVGNAFETPLSEIWRSARYGQLRRKVFQDKSQLDKCRACGVNFQPSDNAWFIDRVDFRAGLADRVREKARRLLRKGPGRRWGKAALSALGDLRGQRATSDRSGGGSDIAPD